MNKRLMLVALCAVINTPTYSASFTGTWRVSYKVGSSSYTDTLYLKGTSAANITGYQSSNSLSGSMVGSQVCVVESEGTYLSSVGYTGIQSWCFNIKTKNAHNIAIFVPDSGNTEDIVSGTSISGSVTKISSLLPDNETSMVLDSNAEQEIKMTEVYQSLIESQK